MESVEGKSSYFTPEVDRLLPLLVSLSTSPVSLRAISALRLSSLDSALLANRWKERVEAESESPKFILPSTDAEQLSRPFVELFLSATDRRNPGNLASSARLRP